VLLSIDSPLVNVISALAPVNVSPVVPPTTRSSLIVVSPVIVVIPSIFMFPVVAPPRVRVLLSKDWIEELAALRTTPLLLDPASVATGVSVTIPVIAN
jgi:hypothetical protein